MKRIITIMLAIGSLLFTSFSATGAIGSEDDVKIAAVESYTLKMRLNVPRIYNNTQSLGSRKY